METPTIESIIDLYGDKPLPPTPRSASSIYLTPRRSPRSPLSIQSPSSSSGSSTRHSTPLTPIYSRFVTERDIDSAKRISERFKRGRIFPNLSHLDQAQAQTQAQTRDNTVAPISAPPYKAKPSHLKPVPFTEWKAPPYRKPGLADRRTPDITPALSATTPKSPESEIRPSGDADDYFSFRPYKGYGSPSRTETSLTDSPVDVNAALGGSLRANDVSSDHIANEGPLSRDALLVEDPSVEVITAQLSSISGFNSTRHSSDVRLEGFPYFPLRKLPPHGPAKRSDEGSRSREVIQGVAEFSLDREHPSQNDGVNTHLSPVSRSNEHTILLETPHIPHHPSSSPLPPSSTHMSINSLDDITPASVHYTSPNPTQSPSQLSPPLRAPALALALHNPGNPAIQLSSYQLHGKKAWKTTPITPLRTSPRLQKTSLFFSFFRLRHRRRRWRKASKASMATSPESSTATKKQRKGTDKAPPPRVRSPHKSKSELKLGLKKNNKTKTKKKIAFREIKHIDMDNNTDVDVHAAASSPPYPYPRPQLGPHPDPRSHSLHFNLNPNTLIQDLELQELQDDSTSGVEIRALRRKEAELVRRRRWIEREREIGASGIPF